MKYRKETLPINFNSLQIDSPEHKARLVVFLGLVPLLAFGLVRSVQFAWVCDDAFLSFRYAENFINGLGLVYNVGQRVEGYTNFLWTILIAGFMKLGFSPIPVSEILGILSFLGLAICLALRSWRKTNQDKVVFFPLAAALVLILEDFQVWATGGLETMLFTYLAVQAILLTVREDQSSSKIPLLAGFLFSLLYLTRPDGLLFAFCGGLSYLLLPSGSDVKGRLKPFFLMCLPVVITLSVSLPIKYFYYGDIFPTAFYSKSVLRPYYSQGLLYSGLFFQKNWFICASIISLFALFIFKKIAFSGREKKETLFFAFSGLLYLLYVTHVGGDFMFARRIIPAAPFLFLVFENLINRITIPKVKYSLVSIILLSAFFPVSVFSNVEQKIKGIANEKDYYTDSVIRVRKAQGELAGKTFGGLPARIMFQGGMLNFAYFSKLPYLVEMSGLTNYEIAKRKIAKRKYIGHEKIVEEKWVIDNGIHFLVMHDAPPFENVQSNRRPHRFNELYIKDSVKVSIVLYDDKVMDELREHPDVAFMPIEEVIDLFKKEMESKDSRVAKALLERLDTFYFRNSGPKGQVWRKELEEMISKK